jgi:pimeloyl-ACP methyl ester carboxylesterase
MPPKFAQNVRMTFGGLSVTNKTPLLLVPGLVSTRLMWEDQINGLADIADCWVTPLPAYDNLEKMAEEILAIAPNKFAVAGHSLGGYLCFELFRLAPHRISKMGLFSTVCTPETDQVAKRRTVMIEEAEKHGFLAMIRASTPRFVVKGERGHEVEKMMEKQAFEVGQTAFCQHQKAATNRRNYQNLLAKVTCPTLVLAGKQDIVTRPSVQRRMAKSIPQAVFHAIDGAAHMITMEQVDQTNDLMRNWLAVEPMALAALV